MVKGGDNLRGLAAWRGEVQRRPRSRGNANVKQLLATVPSMSGSTKLQKNNRRALKDSAQIWQIP
jgi:hypothetical protein